MRSELGKKLLCGLMGLLLALSLTPAVPAEDAGSGQGSLHLEITGDGEGTFTLTRDENSFGEGALQSGETVVLDGLNEGNYVFTLTLPGDVMLSGLNGSPTARYGTYQWQVVVTAGQANTYRMEFTRTASLSGRVNADATELIASGSRMTRSTVPEDGAYAFSGLYPDIYVITAKLPAGDYAGDGWAFTLTEGDIVASITVTAEGGVALALPELRSVSCNDIGGILTDEDGQPLSGVAITLTDESDAVVAETVTDAAGAWLISVTSNGRYVVRAAAVNKLAALPRAVDVAGKSVTDVQLTAVRTGNLIVSAFSDKNANGARGTYESYLAGVEVTVLTDEGIAWASGVTKEDGQAVFEGLPAATYTLRVTVPEHYAYGPHHDGYRTMDNLMQASMERVQVSPAFPVEANGDRYLGIGALPLNSVSGTVWEDQNSDGIWQEEEPGLSGVAVVLSGPDGVQLGTSTDASGAYRFDDLNAGKYTLTVTLPEGSMFTRSSTTGGGRRSIITAEGVSTASADFSLSGDETKDNQNIGVMESATIRGTCFLDANYNGFLDEGEDAMAGVLMELRRPNGRVVASMTTGADGVFTFSGLRGGTYSVRALLPADGSTYTVVTNDPAGNQFRARPNRREYIVEDVVLADFQELGMVVGVVYPATISGVAYLDENFSGAMDDGEETVSGLGLVLLDEQGQKVTEGRTNARGRYTFENIMPGTYRLSLDAKRGYAFTHLGEGSVIVNTGDGSGQSELFQVTLGANLDNMSMGMIRPGVVQGAIFADANDNGKQDEGEGGLAGATVRLIESTRGEAFAATVGEDGAFRFDAVMPGSYLLRYELPEDGVFSAGCDLSQDGSVGESAAFSFKEGDEYTAPTRGGLTLGSVAGAVYNDRDGSGTQDEGEAPLAGVTLTLTPTRGDLTEVSCVTGEDGAFTLTGLRPDTYRLTVSFPHGYAASRMNGVTLPLRAGAKEQTVDLPVAMGQRWMNQLLGGTIPAALTGQVWLDENNNGLRDDGEATPAGEAVTVIDQATGETFATLTTDASGVFATDGLVPGRYTVAYRLSESVIAPQPGDTTFAASDGQMIADITAVENETVGGLTLGIVKLTSISGRVWHDNGGTIVDLPGAQVKLADVYGNVLAETVSDASGLYRFDGLLPGDYKVLTLLPEGQVVVEPGDERLTSGGMVSIMTDCRNREAASDAITLRMGADQAGMDIGSVQPGRLGDRVWLDENGNGLQDLDEGGIPGVTVELLRDGVVVATTVSDQYGFYFFTSIYPATYTLRVTAPAEVAPTTQRSDIPAAASVLTATGESIPVSVRSDSRNYDADLGFVLVTPGVYPAGYGQGATQDWTRIGW